MKTKSPKKLPLNFPCTHGDRQYHFHCSLLFCQEKSTKKKPNKIVSTCATFLFAFFTSLSLPDFSDGVLSTLIFFMCEFTLRISKVAVSQLPSTIWPPGPRPF
ncbi:hypothetical protein PGT21_026167 [Puccinia graminis f. sp. tritici]|uniref:Uncharacterized protein n=1 Tax=Puccinia graminis f. sp. tritici TaxID=56615 RepID=A0A5B0M3A3_PUCGR|nr:hypothetical protein PGT21_026167 [Puccinia graminis f. sp. tritici]KAA1132620.1 hypothetical protein PGTUg99_015809 [Puccinia graminis f. sp. tritici]